jgi:hypothetical protein
MTEQLPATQRDTTAEQKMLQSLIEAASANDPRIKARVTVAAVWQYLRLPDSSFGWVPRVNAGDPTPPLPMQCKALCVITTLSLGLIPGLGNVLWLGNKCFIDIYGKRTLTKRDGYRPIKRNLRPFTEAEREMFALKPGDMALVLEQKYCVGIDPQICDGVGYGIIDSNEFNTGKKPGLGTRKDAAMSLITRAERDFYNREFPIDGLPDMPEDPRAYAEQLEPTPLLSSEATTIAATLADPNPPPALRTAPEQVEHVQARGNLRRAAATRMGELIARVSANGGNASEITGLAISAHWSEGADADTLNDAGDVLEAWLAENEPPPPAPPAGDGPRKRGRKSNAEREAIAAAQAVPTSPMPIVAPPIPVTENRGAGADLQGAGEPEAAAAPAPNLGRAAEIELDARDKAEFRLRDAISRVVNIGGAPMKILGFNPHNRIADPKATSHELDATSDLLDKWAPDKPSAVEKNVAAGVVQHVRKPPTDEAPPPDDRDAPAPSRPTPVAATKPAPAPAARPLQAAPPPQAAPRQGGTRTPANDMLDRILASDAAAAEKMPPETMVRIKDLRQRALRPDDHLRLPNAFRESKAGNHRGLDELLTERPMVK